MMMPAIFTFLILKRFQLLSSTCCCWQVVFVHVECELWTMQSHACCKRFSTALFSTYPVVTSKTTPFQHVNGSLKRIKVSELTRTCKCSTTNITVVNSNEVISQSCHIEMKYIITYLLLSRTLTENGAALAELHCRS